MVSVIIATYNRAKTIKESIYSVLKQSYSDIELIIIDDGSTDDTRNVVESINDSRIQYYRKENEGACIARNYGVQQSTGEYIAFQDSDDLWHADKLQKQMDIMDEYHPDVVFCKMNMYVGDELREILPPHIDYGFVSPIKNLYCIGTQSLLGKREVFIENPFDSEMPRWQDFELLVRICEKCSLFCVDEPLVDYRVGEDSISKNGKKLIKACRLMWKKHPEINQKYPEMRTAIRKQLTYDIIDRRDKSLWERIQCIDLFIKYRDTNWLTFKRIFNMLFRYRRHVEKK